MTTTGVVGGNFAAARIAALADELRLLKSSMADMQGRLDGLLHEIGSALAAPEISATEAAIAEPQALIDAEDERMIAHTEPVLAAEGWDADADQDEAEVSVGALEPAHAAIAQPEIIDTEIMTVEGLEPSAELEATLDAEAVTTEAVEHSAEATSIGSDIVADAASNSEAIQALQPIAGTELAADAVAVEASSAKVIALAEHRSVRARRGVVARAGRWAAVIALIAVVAAVAAQTGFAGAAGMNFAGPSELLTLDDLCLSAGDTCVLMLSTF
jgi:hypothetical protein